MRPSGPGGPESRDQCPYGREGERLETGREEARWPQAVVASNRRCWHPEAGRGLEGAPQPTAGPARLTPTLGDSSGQVLPAPCLVLVAAPRELTRPPLHSCVTGRPRPHLRASQSPANLEAGGGAQGVRADLQATPPAPAKLRRPSSSGRCPPASPWRAHCCVARSRCSGNTCLDSTASPRRHHCASLCITVPG